MEKDISLIKKISKIHKGTPMQPRQLREKIKALKQEINMLNSQTDILKDKLESRDLKLE